MVGNRLWCFHSPISHSLPTPREHACMEMGMHACTHTLAPNNVFIGIYTSEGHHWGIKEQLLNLLNATSFVSRHMQACVFE